MLFRVMSCFALLISAAGVVDAQDLEYPRSVAVDQMGRIYIADAGARAVFKLDPSGAHPVALARADAKYPTPLYSLSGIAVTPGGDIAVSDSGSSNVYRLVGGKPIAVADPDPKKNPFSKPQALAFDAAGDLIIPDLGEQAVFRISGNTVARIAAVGAPTGVCIDKAGNIVVVSASQRRLTRIDRAGKTTPIADGAPFEFPLAVAAHADGSYAVADGYAQAVFKVTIDGKVSVLAKGGAFRHPDGIAAEPGGSFVVADPSAKAIFRVGQDGKVSVIHSWK
jgi:sugar lactone lactonase YvrE